MRFEFSNLLYVDLVPDIEFTREGEEQVHRWNKLEVSDQNFNKFWLSATDDLAKEIVGDDEKLLGKAIKVSGTFRIYKGIPKFKVDTLTLEK